MKDLKLNKISETTVWNYHNIILADVGFRKGSNLNKKLKELYEKGIRGMVTIYVEAIGSSAHNASRLGIYEGTTNISNFNMYYSNRHAEYRMDMFNE